MDRTEFEIQRGERAAQLLQDELLNEALETIKREYHEQWESSPVRDAEGQKMLLLMVKTVGKFRAELESVLETGQLAKARLERQTLAQQVGQMLSPSF